MSGAIAKPSPTMTAICCLLATLVVVGAILAPLVTADAAGPGDQRIVYRSPDVWTITWDTALYAFRRFETPAGTGGYYQPLVYLTYMADARLTGSSDARPFFFHVGNLGLHLLNVGLVFGLVRRLSGSVVWAVLLALLFGLHPIQVASVASIEQRYTLLGASFALAAIACHLRLGRTEGAMWMPVVMLCYMGAVLSNPLLVGLPLFLLLLDGWPLRRFSGRVVVEKIPLFLTMLTVVGIHAWARAGAAVVGTDGYATLLLRSLAGFAQRLAFPFALSPVYPVVDPAPAVGAGELAVVLLACAALALSFRGARVLFTALAGVAVFALPALVDLPYSAELLGDEYLYLALLPPIIVTAAWMRIDRGALRPRVALAAGVATASLIGLFGLASNRYTAAWENGAAFFERIVRTHPDWVPGYAGLVDWHLRRDPQQALRWARAAAEAAPDSGLAQFCVGTALLQLEDRADDAIAPLRRALDTNPQWPECLQNLGTALARTGRSEEAVSYLEKARDLAPRSSDVRIGLGYTYLDLDRPGDARRELQVALKHRNQPLVHMGLAMAWARQGVLGYAMRHLQTAIQRDRRYAARAARTPEFDVLADHPGFAALIETGTEPAEAGRPTPWDFPTAGTGGI